MNALHKFAFHNSIINGACRQLAVGDGTCKGCSGFIREQSLSSTIQTGVGINASSNRQKILLISNRCDVCRQ